MLTLGWPDGNSFVPARIMCVRNQSNRKDWLALISTDTNLIEGIHVFDIMYSEGNAVPIRCNLSTLMGKNRYDK